MFGFFFRFLERRREPKALPPQRRSFRPCLEVLEDRITPTNSTWVATGGTPQDPLSWNNPAAWALVAGPGNSQGYPDATDMAIIGNGGTSTPGYVIIPSGTANVAEVSVAFGGLTVNGELDVAQNGNTAGFTGGLGSDSGGTLTDNGTIKVTGGPNQLAGSTNVNGAFDIQGSAYEVMTGPGVINPGGHIDDFGDAQFILDSGEILHRPAGRNLNG
jgi:hypothetical protein